VVKIVKNLQIVIISTVILSSVIIGTSIGFFIWSNTHISKSNCDGRICVDFSVDYCSEREVPDDIEITVINRVVIFNQNLLSYCGPPLWDPNYFRMELSFTNTNLIIREILTTDWATRCVCPYNITGTISILPFGRYNLTFIFDCRYINQVHTLKSFELNIE